MRSHSRGCSIQAKVVGLGLTFALSATAFAGVPSLAWAETQDLTNGQVVATANEDPGVDVTEAALAQETSPLADGSAQPAASDAVSVAESAEPATDVSSGTVAEGSETTVVTASDPDDGPDVATVDPSTVAPEEATPAAAAPAADAEAATPQAAVTAVQATETVSEVQATAGEPSQAKTAPDTSGYEHTYVNMYRLYNPNSGEHFYTKSLDEAKADVVAGWRWENVAWMSPTWSTMPVYRLYSGTDHHYTEDLSERDFLVKAGWKLEGIGWYSMPSEVGQAVYRLYNPNVNPTAKRNNSGSHHYTPSTDERDSLVAAGWRSEGIGWYASCVPSNPIQGFWIETGAWGNGKQLYWIDSNAQLAVGRVVDPTTSRDAGAGYKAYATTGTGAVVRGKTITSGGMMFASSKGEYIDLASLGATSDNWLVTDKIDGSLQRYYVIRLDNGQLGAKVGQFTASISGTSSTFYARRDQGYVLRNASTQLGNWKWYWADNEGRLTFISSGKVGWQNPSGYYQVSAYDVSLPSYASGFFAYTTDSRIRPEATRSQVVEAFINRAYEYLGTPYKWDYALAPGVGIDCSGLVMQCMEAVGIKSVYNSYDHMYDPWQDHDASNMLQDSKIPHVAYSDRRRGDLIFYTGHVAIYLGNNQIIHSSNYAVPYDGVQISSIGHRGVIAVGRLFA